MRKSFSLLLAFPIAAFSLLLASCNSTGANVGSNNPPQGSVPVSLTMTDDPPSGVTPLFFQVSLTAAALDPAVGTGPSISLLSGNKPIQIDVTQLQAQSAFLGSADVPAGTYGNVSLTFANPEIVIFNQSDVSLGASCPVGTICTLAPAIDNSATVSFSSSPLPVTLTANSPLGFLIDFHLNTIIQSDLSVNLGVVNGITLSQVPPNASGATAPFGFLMGTVGTVSGDQFTMTTAWGKTFTIDVDSNTKFIDWPPCASPGTLSCLKAGAVVQVQVASVESDGSLLAAKVKWLLAVNAQSLEGTVVGFNATQIKLLLHVSLGTTTPAPLGAVATVTLDKNTAFSVDTNGFTIPSGLTFQGVENLFYGQELQVAVDSGTVSCVTSNVIPGPPPTCTLSTNSVQLEPGQMSGAITALDSANSSFTLSLPAAALPPGLIGMPGLTVETTSQTTYEGFANNSFSGLTVDDLVSVNGWLFEQDNGLLDPAMTLPLILAQDVKLHSAGM